GPGTAGGPAPEQQRAGDRGADEGAGDEAAHEPARALVVAADQLREVRAAAEGTRFERPGRGAIGTLVAHRQPTFRDWGPSVVRIVTIPIAIHATTVAGTSGKSPIASHVTPSRLPIAAPAHAPSTAATNVSGSRPPAWPRMRT